MADRWKGPVSQAQRVAGLILARYGGLSKSSVLDYLHQHIAEARKSSGLDEFTPPPSLVPGTLLNLGVNTIPGDLPISLSSDEYLLLAHGLRFIVGSTAIVAWADLEHSINRLEHSLAIACLFSKPKPPRTVGDTLLPYRPPATGNLLSLPPGSVKSTVSTLREELRKELLAAQGRVPLANQNRWFNLPASAAKAVRSLRTRLDVVIRGADKNLGPTICSKFWYVSACRQHLDDTSVYTKVGVLDEAYRGTLINTLCNQLSHILEAHMKAPDIKGLIGNRDTLSLPIFYVLPKLHKIRVDKPFESRPICAQTGSITERASKIISGLLRTRMDGHWWALKDSAQCIRELEALPLPDSGTLSDMQFIDNPSGQSCDLWVFSCDVASLYPNMHVPTTVGVVCRFVKMKLVEEGTSGTVSRNTMVLLKKLLEWVFFSTYFTFDAGDGVGPTVYKQNFGVPMGSSSCPLCANLYVASIVQATVQKYSSLPGRGRLLFCRGYIDDIFGVMYGTREDIGRFVNELEAGDPSGKLKLTVEAATNSNPVPFLDLSVSIVSSGGRNSVRLRPYSKAQNRFLYLPPWSAHAPRALGSFISGEAMRLIRNSSCQTDAIDACFELMAHLVARGYSVNLILRELLKVSYSRRQRYLRGRQRTAEATPPATASAPSVPRPIKVAMVNVFTTRTASLPLRRYLRRIENAMKDDAKKPARVVLAWRNARNLESMLNLSWPKADATPVRPEAPEPSP